LVSKNDLTEIDIVKLLSTQDRFKKKIEIINDILGKSSSSSFSNQVTPNLSPNNKDNKKYNIQINNSLMNNNSVIVNNNYQGSQKN